MNQLKKEIVFFHDIAKIVCDFVVRSENNPAVAQHKREGDFSTVVDVAVEELIVKEISDRFPQDAILAEENHTNAEIPEGKIWIIDPICGTNNLARGINNFCTNIALAENNTLIASCVIDHSNNNYYWSVGNGEIFINETLYQAHEERFDVMIDVDFGAVASVETPQRERHNRFLKELMTQNNYYLISLNTSLGFAYTAIGKVDGFLNIFNYPWDICAASFLIQQSGGIITDLVGNPWTLQSSGAIAGKNKAIHQKLLETYLSI